MTAERDKSEGHKVSRRSVVRLAAAAITLPISIRIGDAHGAEEIPAAFSNIKAVTLDIQGTVFDYYQPFRRVTSGLDKRKGLHLSWAGFLRDWNANAASMIQSIITGQRAWAPPGQIYRESLDALLLTRGLARHLEEADRSDLMSIWSQMVPWRDSVEGIGRLKRHVTVAALSNAGMASVIALAKRNGLSFDAVLTGELVRSYKPSLDVYRAASAFLGFQPGEIMMIAAHRFDLKAAKEAGFQTAFVSRPLEMGPDTSIDRSAEPYIDILVENLIELSTKVNTARSRPNTTTIESPATTRRR